MIKYSVCTFYSNPWLISLDRTDQFRKNIEKVYFRKFQAQMNAKVVQSEYKEYESTL